MAEPQIDEIVKRLQSIAAAPGGPEALATPHRGDYAWTGDQPPPLVPAIEDE